MTDKIREAIDQAFDVAANRIEREQAERAEFERAEQERIRALNVAQTTPPLAVQAEANKRRMDEIQGVRAENARRAELDRLNALPQWTPEERVRHAELTGRRSPSVEAIRLADSVQRGISALG